MNKTDLVIRRLRVDLDLQANTLSRFRQNVQVDADGCHLWAGTIDRKGYGRLSLARSGLFAHRVAYELFTGPIPDGLHIDHLCRVPACVNPDHLEAVTLVENTRRGLAPVVLRWDATHCPKGHEYTEANTKHGKNGRQCRTCSRDYDRRRYHRLRQEAAA